MPSHLDAFSEPPDVKVLNGEVLILGPYVSAAYTAAAVEQLIERLKRAAEAARQQELQDRRADPPAHLRLCP